MFAAAAEQQNMAHAISMDWCWRSTPGEAALMEMLSYSGSSSIGGQVNTPIFWYYMANIPKLSLNLL